uniref:Fungal lipase-like domain-containing protein n=1 Tax=Acrobeloides nanus TaxID=290746 RepID=A0A914DJ77_9BILA
MVNFGQPRVGNVDLAMKHDQLLPYSFRVVHRMDIVPHMPACAKDHTLVQSGSSPCSPNNKKKSYHHGVEVWYPNTMKPGDQYIVCLGQPKDEDFSCSDRNTFSLNSYKSYIADHRHYFEVEVPDFGKTGCNPNEPEGDYVEHGIFG